MFFFIFFSNITTIEATLRRTFHNSRFLKELFVYKLDVSFQILKKKYFQNHGGNTSTTFLLLQVLYLVQVILVKSIFLCLNYSKVIYFSYLSYSTQTILSQ